MLFSIVKARGAGISERPTSPGVIEVQAVAGMTDKHLAPGAVTRGETDCETADMVFDVLFTGVPVSDFNTSHAWYESFFGRPADIVAHELEVMWRVSDGGWLYILHDPDHAGNGIVAMAVANIEQAISALNARGVTTGPIKPEGGAGRKAVALDPDGNSIAIIEVNAGP
jgi:predicted enzyme related to lactoylglutathione lyase